MRTDKRYRVHRDDPSPLGQCEPSRFGGLSEYGQPGCLRSRPLPIPEPFPSLNVSAPDWQYLLGDLRREWPRITRKDFEWANGDLHDLAGLIQMAYQVSGPDADRQVHHFFDDGF